VRGFWTAELHRQQTAIVSQLVRQTMAFWTRTWMVPTAGPKSKHRR
jgi:hypothetical protein